MQSSLAINDVAPPPPDTDELVASAVLTLDGILDAHPLVIAWSGGKDSTATLILALLALVERKSAQRPPAWPLYVMHGDTLAENPAISQLAREQLALLQQWCDNTGIELRVVITTPRLSDNFFVNVCSGGMLPTYPNSKHRQCSAKWKLEPAKVGMRQILADVRSASSDPGLRIVTAIGTRHDESAVRSGNMSSRGDNARTPVDHDGRLLLAPIADWTEDDVWELLGSSGTRLGLYPVWQDDFGAIANAYRDALSGECPVVAGAGKIGKSGCGSRFGCATCLAVGEDKSMTAMTADARHAHLAPLLEIRNFMRDIQYDWSRRNWVTRQIETIGGQVCVKIQPDHFDSRTLIEIVGAYLLADADEQVRADAFDSALQAGAVPDDVYVKRTLADGEPFPTGYCERMRKPQFRFLPDQILVALDFYSAVLHKHRRPFQVLELAHRINAEGYRPKAPMALTGLPQKPPAAPRWLPIGPPPDGLPGLGEPITIALASEGCRLGPDIYGQGADLYYAQGSTTFDVDAESASLIVGLLYPQDWRRMHRDERFNNASAIQRYLSLGAVSLSPQGRTKLHRIAKTRQHIQSLGLYDCNTAALLAQCLPPAAPPQGLLEF